MNINTIWPWVMVISAGAALRVGIASVAPLLVPIQDDLAVGAGAVGLLTAIPVICMGGLSWLGSATERRWGMKRSMVAALALLATGVLWRGWVHSFSVLLLTAVLVGVGDALIRPLLSGFIKQTFEQRAHVVMGVYAASMGIGAAFSAYTTPWLANAFSSWQWALGCWGLGVLGALVLWCCWTAPRSLPEQSPPVSIVPARSAVLWLTLFFGLQAGINYTVVAWLPSVSSGLGLTAVMASAVMGIFLLIQTAASLLFPLILRKNPHTMISASAVFTALIAGGAALLYSATSVWGAAVLLGVGTGGLFPVALSLPLLFSSTGRDATRLSSVSQSGGYLLGGVMPWLAGALMPWIGTPKAMIVLCVLMALLLGGVVGRVAVHYTRYTAQ